MLTHKLLIAAFWLIATVAGFAFVQSATNALSQQFSLPGQPAYETNVAILKMYGTGGTDPPVVPVITLPPGHSVTSPSEQRAIAADFAHIARELAFARVVSYSTDHSNVFISSNHRTTFGLIFLPLSQGFSASPGLPRIQSYFQHQSIDGVQFRVTGLEPLASGSGGGGGPGVLAEAIIGGFGALIVLVFVFRSFMALVPLAMALIAIPTTFLLVWALTSITQVSFIVQYLIALIGLGVAIDYSLLIVIRWREERAHGSDNLEAVRRTMQTAGVAVIFSGTTVAIGLFALVALPVPFLQSVGYGGMLIPLVSVLIAITVLPVILATIGPKIDWPRSKRRAQAESDGGRVWMAWGRLVVRARWVAAAAALIVLALLLWPLTSIVIGNSRADSLAQNGPAYQGLHQLDKSGIGAGALTPFELMVARGTSYAGRNIPPAVNSALAGVSGVRGVVGGSGSSWSRAGTVLYDVVPAADGATAAGQHSLNGVKSVLARGNSSKFIRLGGYTAQGQNFVTAVYGNFPLMILLIVLVTFILLARAFRSVILPLKAVILNVMSVGAAWGAMTWIWQDGNGSKAIWGIAATGGITAWIPLMVFAFLFGLSMDYEVFILSRTREEYDRLGSTNEAISVGIGRTGRLVTSAALILFLAFVSLGAGPDTDIKVLATGLAVGILLDATIIRSLLVPALVSLLGEWNWWLPDRVAWLLRVNTRTARPSGSSR